ncbi:tannase/feruloyl esterase family alpha/beta hydrolase [Allokutzneria albata]|uniref:Tannase and feruloyl esterase n=1 Tax=Allokutzneria albata TaxID=211114 RepID=A0A1G9RZZ1_ALLAB|nr:tannase/feruloyl esterase family alpha/beta hydrolase [Allokutzneria albata]SDM28065.1 Tannase and feruloyl esterase [Allokutzneria albata]
MKKVCQLLVTLMLAAGLPAAIPAKSACAAVSAPAVPGARVLSVSGVERPAGEAGMPGRPPITGVPARCEVTVVLSHPDTDDRVRVEVWLPLRGWTGRFLGTGGGGFATGFSAEGLAPAVKDGFAAAATDGGIGLNPISPAAWALDASGRVNWGLLTNFATRSVHDMTVVGKAVTRSFYGRAPAYSYWNGCSTGGRQGLAEAQLHPRDYDGIVAGGPAIDMPRSSLAQFWPQVVMNQERTRPSACEFDAFTRAAVDDCDLLDGVADRVIGDPAACRFDPARLVGTKTPCGTTITAATAEVVRRIWDGPRGHTGRLGQGLVKGGSFAELAGAAPLPIADNWIRYFLGRDPGMDTTKIDYSAFERLVFASTATYDHLLANTRPDLSAFRAAGGRLLVWHGLADAEIAPGTTIDYRERVERVTGPADGFFRLFLAPGSGHCGTGVGVAPVDPMGAMIAWVERGRAPDTLAAATADGRTTRDLCRHPRVPIYDGHGDPDSATSFRCSGD